MSSRRAPACDADGGTGTIVFSHANGFPAGTYRVLFERWRAAGWRVEAVERFGHDPAFPVTSNWPHLRDELLQLVDARRAAPALFVGHSLGGFLSLIAACWRPAAACGVVMLDSPLVGGWKAHGLQVFKATGLVARVSPGRVSQRRRTQWPSAEAAHAHFAAKHVFARWDPRVLADYVAAGVEPCDDGGVALCFRREVETRIYNTLPHHLPALLKRHPPRCPVAFVGGTQSVEVRQVGLATTRAVTRGRLTWIEGSHLFPMERPDETADAVLEIAASFAREREGAATAHL